MNLGTCDVCRNRAELTEFKSDGRKLCGDCTLVMNSGSFVKKGEKKHQAQERFAEEMDSNDLERDTYLEIIKSKATEKWVKNLIKEIIAKKILQYDWFRVIQQSRWFSVLDLRRFALDLDPEFEASRVEEPELEENTPEEEEKKADAETEQEMAHEEA